MQNSKLILQFILLLFLVVFSGCHKDEGQTSFDRAMDKYGQVLKDGLNEKNTEDAKLFGSLLKILIKAHPNEKSSQAANEKLEQLQKISQTRKLILDNDLEEKSKPVIEAMLAFEHAIRPLAAKARK